MRYLVNENIPLGTVKLLRDAGIDIVSVTDVLLGSTDEEIIEFAVKENCILITFDKDFGELIFKRKFRSKGIILLRFSPQSPEYIAEKLKSILASKEITLEYHITVATTEKIRNLPLD